MVTGKFSSRMLPKLYQHIQWVYIGFLQPFASASKVWLSISGGLLKVRKEEFIGANGSYYAIQRCIGFIDFNKFNQALLAKQAWRILTNLDSLAEQIYKDKYFPSGTFLDAKTGHNSSYVWRSILWGRELLHKSVLWRIWMSLSSENHGSCFQIYLDPLQPQTILL